MAEDVRAYIAAEIRKLLATGEFVDGLPGYLVSNKRAGTRLNIARTVEKIA